MKTPFLRSTALLSLLFIYSCAEQPELSPLNAALASDSPEITKVLDQAEQHEVQILFTQVNRQGDTVQFTDESYQVDPEVYFYPASSVKFPIAFLALEQIAHNDSINSNSRFFVEGDSVETTIREEVKKIFAVSDNDAYNRLYEFLGTDHINARLKEMQAGPVRIAHRLSVPDADVPETRPLLFYLNDTTLTEWPGTVNTPPAPLPLQRTMKGDGYYAGDSLISEPMDFSLKNYLPVTTLHNLMKRVIFPDNFAEEETFDLNTADREFALQAMSALPHTQGYDRKEYYDSYVKFFLFGDKKEPMPEHIRIFNKVGYAYGYLTDCAYIRDDKNQVEFILTATIHVNEDRIYNDNNYEYEEVGIPFLAELGRQIHQALIR